MTKLKAFLLKLFGIIEKVDVDKLTKKDPAEIIKDVTAVSKAATETLLPD